MRNRNKITVLTFLFVVAALMALGIASFSQGVLAQNNNGATLTQSDQNLKVFSTAELKKYDGQNGRPAYVAVDGKVYDVTNVPAWKGGKHYRGIQAGTDLTEAIKKAPHGVSVLAKLTIVGIYSGK